MINGLDETIAFRPCEKLLIDIAADVPTRTFAADYDPSQAIRLTVDGQPKAGPFFADRDAKTFLVDLGETLTLRTEVHDYSVTLLAGRSGYEHRCGSDFAAAGSRDRSRTAHDPD